MKDSTHDLIMEIEDMEDLKKFNKFEFKNPYKLNFIVYWNSSKCFAEYAKYPNPLKAFRIWLNKKERCGYFPSVSAETKHGESIGTDFSALDLHITWPYNYAMEYQKFLDRVTDHVEYLKEHRPEDL